MSDKASRLIGIDIVDIDRLRQAVARTPRLLHRVFTDREIDYCYRKRDPFPSLAARFAAREALRKLDQVFILGIRFHDTEVVVDSEGRPGWALHGNALEKARDAGISQIELSLSHSREHAVAVVIAKKG